MADEDEEGVVHDDVAIIPTVVLYISAKGFPWAETSARAISSSSPVTVSGKLAIMMRQWLSTEEAEDNNLSGIMADMMVDEYQDLLEIPGNTPLKLCLLAGYLRVVFQSGGSNTRAANDINEVRKAAAAFKKEFSS